MVTVFGYKHVEYEQDGAKEGNHCLLCKPSHWLLWFGLIWVMAFTLCCHLWRTAIQHSLHLMQTSDCLKMKKKRKGNPS